MKTHDDSSQSIAAIAQLARDDTPPRVNTSAEVLARLRARPAMREDTTVGITCLAGSAFAAAATIALIAWPMLTALNDPLLDLVSILYLLPA